MARFLSLSDSFPSKHCQPPSLPALKHLAPNPLQRWWWRWWWWRWWWWHWWWWSWWGGCTSPYSSWMEILEDLCSSLCLIYLTTTCNNWKLQYRSEALIKKREVQSVWFIILTSDAPPPSPSAAAVKNCLQISQFSPKNPTFFHAI